MRIVSVKTIQQLTSYLAGSLVFWFTLCKGPYLTMEYWARLCFLWKVYSSRLITRYEFIQTYSQNFHRKHTIYYQTVDQFTVSQVQVVIRTALFLQHNANGCQVPHKELQRNKTRRQGSRAQERWGFPSHPSQPHGFLGEGNLGRRGCCAVNFRITLIHPESTTLSN